MCLEESFCPFTRDALNFWQPKIYAAPHRPGFPSPLAVITAPRDAPFNIPLILLSYRSFFLFFIIKLRWALFVTYTIIQSITSSEMCLNHPSAHTLGAVGRRHCGAQGAVGGSVPCSRVSPQSWTIPAGAEIRTHNLRLQVRRSIH